MPRTLTTRERETLIAMIAHASEGSASPEQRRRWTDQVPDTRVGGVCECGTCPSIELVDAEGREPDMDGERIVLTAGLRDGTALMLLFIDDDRLSYLELAPVDETVFAEFPPAGELGFAD